MKQLLFIIITCMFVFKAYAVSISTKCTSESGRSEYTLNLDTNARDGMIRYKFMEQDVFYKVIIAKVESGIVEGMAVFEKSNTGEDKGNSFLFKYDLNNNVFEELNIIAKCD